MKKLLLLLVILVSAVTLNAQTFNHQRKPLTDFEAFRQHILKEVTSHNKAVQKTTAMQQRVIAEAHYNKIGGPTLAKWDSASFIYSHGRGSTFNYNGGYYNYIYNLGGFPHPIIDPYSFENLDVLADTVRHFIGEDTILNYKIFMLYTAGDKVHNYYIVSDSINNLRERILSDYDAQGRLNLMTKFSWNYTTQQWDSVNRRVIVYNAQDEVVSDTVFFFNNAGIWLPVEALFYTYNASGKLFTTLLKTASTPGNLTDLSKVTYDYYPDNTLRETVYEYNVGGNGIALLGRDSVAYDPGNNYITYHETWTYDNANSQWLRYGFIRRNVNSLGLPDTTWSYMYDTISGSYIQDQYMTAVYNSYKNPTQMEFYSFNGINFDNDYRYFFYYEDFDPTAVNNVSTAPEDMTVYPNPVKNIVHINWKADGKRVHINMVNASGQLVYSESVNRMKETTQVSVSALPAGMYWLTVTDEHGAIIYRTGLLKQ